MIISMIKMMIVDDDKIVLKFLSGITNWKTYGIDLVATALNGKQGLSKFKEYFPNLIISDIKMPFMDGLEMIRQIKTQDLLVYFVILSSYSEFSYAKEAIALGATAYLLKPEITEELIKKTLNPIKKEIREHTETASWSIQRELQAFITSKPQHLSSTIQTICYNFNLFLMDSSTEGCNLLEKNCVELFRNAYLQYGKKDYFMMPQIRSGTDLQKWVLSQLDIVYQWIGETIQKLSPVVSNAITFINKHYSSKSLNIKMIADDVFLSPNWLSAQFKKETGKTVNDYITDVRMKNAKVLLLQGKYKVYEIAELVGYGSSQYFSRVFFQITGQNPQYYRKDEDI